MNEPLPREYTYLSGAELLARRAIPERDVEIPELGTVRVRGLTRGEVLQLKRELDTDFAAFEAGMLACGLVRPELDIAGAKAWQEAARPTEIDPVITAIMELSGMEATAERTAMARFPGGA